MHKHNHTINAQIQRKMENWLTTRSKKTILFHVTVLKFATPGSNNIFVTVLGVHTRSKKPRVE